MSLALNALQPLASTHSLDDFSCGKASLDEWLKRRAQANQLSGARRTFEQIPHLVLVGNPSARLTRENLRQLWVTEFDIATGS